jgi:hypothetical protein
LIVLLAASNGRGGGDFDDEPAGAKEIIGRWAGDRIAIVGDYAEPGDLPDEYRAESIYARCREGNADGNPKFRDITAKVREVLKRELEIEYTGEPDSWMSRKAKGV